MPAQSSPHTFRHEALIYCDRDEFLAGTVPFVRDAVAGGEPVLVAVDRDKAGAIRRELGDDAEPVHFVDMRELGGNPARIIPAWREFAAAHLREGAPVRGIGEPIWPGRSADQLVECQRHEWLLNVAFAGAPAWWLLCPYDAGALDPAVLESALVTHPHVSEQGHARPSVAYRDHRSRPGPFNEPLPPPAHDPEQLVFRRDDLPAIRRLLLRWARDAGMTPRRTDDLLLAVNEVMTNSVRYGGGEGGLSVWRDGGLLLCEVRDGGHLDDPLVGRERPVPNQRAGRGLWVANQVCDLVQIRSSPAGNVVRLHMSVRG